VYIICDTAVVKAIYVTGEAEARLLLKLSYELCFPWRNYEWTI